MKKEKLMIQDNKRVKSLKVGWGEKWDTSHKWKV